jgi:hypothetical protein
MNPDHGGLSSAPVGIPKRRRQAGPQAADRRCLIQVILNNQLLLGIDFSEPDWADFFTNMVLSKG